VNQTSIIAKTPSVEDYCRLRILAGLSPKSVAAATAGLPNTLFGVSAIAADQVIGMGRIIGDGGTAYQIVDIAVDPSFQGQGLGKAIMRNLAEWLRNNAPDTAYVSLIADGEAHRLYSQFGFEPTAPLSIGMAMLIQRA
jgi:GNAT superfamily N-acetyltransferase